MTDGHEDRQTRTIRGQNTIFFLFSIFKFTRNIGQIYTRDRDCEMTGGEKRSICWFLFFSSFQVRPCKCAVDNRCSEGNQIPPAPLDLVHGGLPHLVVRPHLHHVHLRHHAGIRGRAGGGANMQFHHLLMVGGQQLRCLPGQFDRNKVQYSDGRILKIRKRREWIGKKTRIAIFSVAFKHARLTCIRFCLSVKVVCLQFGDSWSHITTS